MRQFQGSSQATLQQSSSDLPRRARYRATSLDLSITFFSTLKARADLDKSQLHLQSCMLLIERTCTRVVRGVACAKTLQRAEVAEPPAHCDQAVCGCKMNEWASSRSGKMRAWQCSWQCLSHERRRYFCPRCGTPRGAPIVRGFALRCRTRRDAVPGPGPESVAVQHCWRP